MLIIVVAWQCLNVDYVGIQATVALQEKISVFCEARADIL
jgi:hypothetical protein